MNDSNTRNQYPAPTTRAMILNFHVRQVPYQYHSYGDPCKNSTRGYDNFHDHNHCTNPGTWKRSWYISVLWSKYVKKNYVGLYQCQEILANHLCWYILYGRGEICRASQQLVLISNAHGWEKQWHVDLKIGKNETDENKIISSWHDIATVKDYYLGKGLTQCGCSTKKITDDFGNPTPHVCKFQIEISHVFQL